MDEQVILIAGKINNIQNALYWKIKDTEKITVAINDYAIVENMNDYDLVKIVGFVTTSKKNAKSFSNTEYEKIKNVIMVIDNKKITGKEE